MGDMKALTEALNFMGESKTWATPMSTYVSAEHKGAVWTVSQSGKSAVLTKNNVIHTVCKDTIQPILDTLKLIKDGDLDPKPNEAALTMRAYLETLTQEQARAILKARGMK